MFAHFFIKCMQYGSIQNSAIFGNASVFSQVYNRYSFVIITDRGNHMQAATIITLQYLLTDCRSHVITGGSFDYLCLLLCTWYYLKAIDCDDLHPDVFLLFSRLCNCQSNATLVWCLFISQLYV